mgnify:FL=1|jgi:hypothetical protein
MPCQVSLRHPKCAEASLVSRVIYFEGESFPVRLARLKIVKLRECVQVRLDESCVAVIEGTGHQVVPLWTHPSGTVADFVETARAPELND